VSDCIVCRAVGGAWAQQALASDMGTVTIEGFSVHGPGRHCLSDAQSALRIREDAYRPGGGDAIVWKSNDNPIPTDLMRIAFKMGIVGVREIYATAIARREHTERTLDEYRRHQPPQPSEEERAQARAAHGPGVDLVDVITGRRFTT
jgi:hypothetical protein